MIQKRTNEAISVFLALVFLYMIYATFTGRSFVNMDKSHYFSSFLLQGESPIVVAINWIFNLNNNLSVLIIFAFIGIFSLFFKAVKTFYDYFFVFVILGFSQFIFEWEYIRLYMNPIYSLFIGIGITYTWTVLSKWKLSMRNIMTITVLLLTAHFIFSGIFVQRDFFIKKFLFYEEGFFAPEAYSKTAAKFLKSDETFSIITSSDYVRPGPLSFYANQIDAVNAQSMFINKEYDFNITKVDFSNIQDSLKRGEKIVGFYHLNDWILDGNYYHGKHIYSLINRFNLKIAPIVIDDYKIKYLIDDEKVPAEEKNGYFLFIQPNNNLVYTNEYMSIYDLNRGKN
ncbi:hypothetical protein HOC11_06125 [archaeon]|nr:hypothetical protein [archaeon]